MGTRVGPPRQAAPHEPSGGRTRGRYPGRRSRPSGTGGSMTGSASGTHPVAGVARPGFEAVRKAFVENFQHRHELGAACCVYHRGEKVVDLSGGVRDPATGEPWEADTMALVHSTTKGMAGMTLALAHSRGLLDYDERVSRYWPEFAQQGRSGLPSASCCPTRPDCSSWTSGRGGVSSPIPTGWTRSSPARSRDGRLGRGRPITRSRSASTRARSCDGSIPGIGPWAGSSRTRLRRRSGSTSTSGCRRRSRTPGWRRSTRPGTWRSSSSRCRSGWCSRP